MSALGWRLHRHGGKHDYWINGENFEAVPKHGELNEWLAKKILKTAKNNPFKK
jgi:hypothetical protein